MKYTTVKIGNTKIKAEIADTSLKKIKGLMFRKNLPENEGMLFTFDKEDYHGIWMINMNFPIDIIWINKDKRVVDLAKNIRPSRLNFSTHKPKEKVFYVLEVNANFIERHGVRSALILEFELK